MDVCPTDMRVEISKSTPFTDLPVAHPLLTHTQFRPHMTSSKSLDKYKNFEYKSIYALM